MNLDICLFYQLRKKAFDEIKHNILIEITKQNNLYFNDMRIKKIVHESESYYNS